MIQIILKNITANARNYFGIEVEPQESKDLLNEGVSQVDLLKDENIIVDWAQGLITINDGIKEVSSVNELIALLKGGLGSLRTTDNRLIVKPNVRPIGTSGFFTSKDDSATPGNIGDGTNLVELDHKIGDPTPKIITQRFNVEGNRSWIFEGYIKYIGAKFDRFCFYISTETTPVVETAGTNFQRYPSKGIIVPAAGTGDVSIDTSNLTTLIGVVPRTDFGTYPTAFWDADYNSTTGKYENLTPNVYGTGKYNIFYQEVVLKRYINNLGLLGTDFFKFETTDPSELSANLKCNYMFTTAGEDHDWQAIVFISMFREKIL